MADSNREGPDLPSPPPTPTAPLSPEDAAPAGRERRKRSNPAIVAALLAVIVLAAVVGFRRYGSFKASWVESEDTAAARLAQFVPRRSVAVLDLRNASDLAERNWLATGLAEMLVIALKSSEELRVVAPETVSRMGLELGLDRESRPAPGALAKIGEALDVDLLVLGSFSTARGSDSLTLELQLLEAATGQTIGSAAEEGTVDEVSDLASRTAANLRKSSGLAAGSDGGSGRVIPQSSREATRFYSQGLEKLRSFEPKAARTYLEQAVRVDPGNALVHSALSTALNALGYRAGASQAARRAYELSSSLPESDRLWIEARHREMDNEWGRAAEIYDSLWRAFPDDLEYGLKSAIAQVLAGKTLDASDTIAALRELPSPATEDPRIDLAAARVAASLSDAEQQQAAAAAAAAKASNKGASLLIAEARILEAEALIALGKSERAVVASDVGQKIFAELNDAAGVATALTTKASALFAQGDRNGAIELLEEARSTFQKVGDRGNEARTLNNIAVVVRGRGDLARASTLYEKVLDLCSEAENEVCRATTLNNLGSIDFQKGRLKQAQEKFERSLEAHRTIAAVRGEAGALDNLAIVLREQGRLAEAQTGHLEALRMRREIGHKAGEASTLLNLAKVERYRGNLPAAKLSCDEGLALSREIDSRSLVAKSLFEQAELFFAEGRLDRAIENHEAALRLRVELGERASGAESALALARLLLETKAPGEAEVSARRALREFQRQGLNDGLALAHSVLALSLAAQDRSDVTMQELGKSGDLARRSESETVRFGAALVGAQILTELLLEEEATRVFEAVRDDLESSDFYALKLEAELVVANLERLSGRPAKARRRLLTLEAQAQRKGFGLLARKAEALGWSLLAAPR